MVNNSGLQDRYNTVRRQTVALSEGLSAEDLCAQSMPDASPGKWHLAHTTWFFETFILKSFIPGYRWFNEKYCFLFNSYYDSVGSRHARPQRGLLTRPSFQEVVDYRHHVDQAMLRLLETHESDIAKLVTIGLHHEMQHQELFLTDLLHLLSHNPMNPAVITRNEKPLHTGLPKPANMQLYDGGLVQVGHDGNEDTSEPELTWQNFSYDCEQPIHQTYVAPFKLSTRLVNNKEWLEFIDDGGYNDPLLWLSDGWAKRQQFMWEAPLYWQKIEEDWFQFGLDGLIPIDPSAPVCHVSMYEADAFARWKQKRLPREHEWDYVAEHKKIAGNFLESYEWRPFSSKSDGIDFEDLYGDVWEWTQSAYAPFPGFNPKQGALGEYNGKFMANQFVLKGGSCVTPRWQMRKSYRNFFYPHQRWQFTGVRLAEDA